MRARSVTLSMPLILAICGWSCAAAAVPFFRTTIFNQIADGSGVIDEFFLDSPVAGASFDLGPVQQAQARASSAVKAVRVSASTTGASATFFSANSRVTQTYTDSFVISAVDAGGVPVPSGVFTAAAFISGNLDASGSGQFSASAIGGASVTVNAVSQSASDNIFANAFGTSSSAIISRPVAITVPWFAGVPVTLQMSATADASGSSGNDINQVLGTFSSSTDLSSTVEWVGIVDVMDESGNPVASFTALNDAGTDYATGLTTAAPVPSASSPLMTAVLLLASLLATVLWRLRRA